MRQIFANLISNACKYSPKGGEIAVASRVDGAEIVFSIRDQGVGISPQDQQRLFSQFQRVGDTHLAPGTGLGLWLTQALIQAHGGRIWLESAPDEGTTFFFSLSTGEVG